MKKHPMTLRVRAILNGQERQSYPVADMIFPPARLVARISRAELMRFKIGQDGLETRPPRPVER